MEEIFEQFKDKDAFDAYWKEHYVPLTYEDVREAYEDFVKSADKHIFLSDYEKSGNVSREDFMDNLSQKRFMRRIRKSTRMHLHYLRRHRWKAGMRILRQLFMKSISVCTMIFCWNCLIHNMRNRSGKYRK